MDYRYGYGGFGYDTSHVPQDEAHSALYIAAKEGDLAEVQALVQKAANNNNNNKLQVINHARRWTEVEYKMSGFIKEYKWFDRTPLMIAIAQGHAPVVKYLLEQGADPTLKACPREDYHLDAAQEAEHACTRANKQNAEAQQAIYIKNMIQTAVPFWNTNTASSSRYDPQRKFQLPKNMNGLLEALDVTLENNTHSSSNHAMGEKNETNVNDDTASAVVDAAAAAASADTDEQNDTLADAVAKAEAEAASSKAATARKAKIAAMRRRRFKKPPTTTTTATEKSSYSDEGAIAAEQDATTTTTDNTTTATPRSDDVTATENESSLQTPSSTTTLVSSGKQKETSPVANNKSEKKYMGVAKMRRKMINKERAAKNATSDHNDDDNDGNDATTTTTTQAVANKVLSNQLKQGQKISLYSLPILMESDEYDTSHVPQDEAHSALYISAKDGDLAKVQALLQKATANNNKLQVLNHIRRWTEMDYKMSGGLTKEHDRTPLMIAISQGHASIVKYLLEQGADPTLKTCPPRDGFHFDAAQEAGTAYSAAMYKVHQLKRIAHFKTTCFVCPSLIKNLLPQQQAASSSSFAYYQERAWALLDAEKQATYIKKMIQTALKFWTQTNNTNTNTTSSSAAARYSDPQCTTSQLPNNMNGILVEALDALGECPTTIHNNRNDNNNNELPLPLYLQNEYQQVVAGLQELRRLLDQGEEAPQKKAFDEPQKEHDKAKKKPVSYSYLARPQARQLGQEQQAVAALPKLQQQQQQQTSTAQRMDGQENKTKKCFFFTKKGSCRNGDDCQFSHELGGNSKGRPGDPWDYYRGRYYEEVDFYRPDGDTEGKDIRWCLDNGFYEIEYGLWSGDWYYRHHPDLKKAARK